MSVPLLQFADDTIFCFRFFNFSQEVNLTKSVINAREVLALMLLLVLVLSSSGLPFTWVSP